MAATVGLGLGLADCVPVIYAERQHRVSSGQGIKEPMSKERLADLLQQLQVELSNTDDLDAELSEQLRATTTEIRQALERDDAAEPIEDDSQGMIAQLRQAAARFEDSHPALTNTVGRIADALAQLGI